MVTFKLGNEAPIKKLRQTDKGVCFLPSAAIKDELEQGQFKTVKVAEGWPQINYSIAYHKRSSLNSISETFINMFS